MAAPSVGAVRFQAITAKGILPSISVHFKCGWNFFDQGSKASITSKETEIKLTNVARASLEELLEDYRDYLRVRDLPVWNKDSREATYVRTLARTRPITYDLFGNFVETRPPEVVANIAICLIHQANYLLDRLVEALGRLFLQEGGLRERMTRARLQARDQKH